MNRRTSTPAALAALVILLIAAALSVKAQTTTPTLEQRVADIEAFLKERFGYVPLPERLAGGTTGTGTTGTGTGTDTGTGSTGDGGTTTGTATGGDTGTGTGSTGTGTTGTTDPPVTAQTGILASPAEIAQLPTTGTAWSSVQGRAYAAWPAPDIDDQNVKHGVFVLAGALVAVRLHYDALKSRAVAGIESVVGTDSLTTNEVLSVGRQISAYVAAADLLGYRTPRFEAWLTHLRDDAIGTHGRWKSIRFCSEDSSNNWGTWSLTARIAIDAYLQDKRDLDRCWAIFRGYGLSGPEAWPFNPTSLYDCRFAGYPAKSGYPFIALAAPGAGDWSGCPVDDASRGTFPEPSKNYPIEAFTGYVLQAHYLARQGYDAWNVNDKQVLRTADFLIRKGLWNGYSVGYFTGPVINAKYGREYPVPSKIVGGRALDHTDWLFGPGSPL